MRYGIALGSNLGDRLAHLRRSVELLLQRLPGAHLVAAAPVYESAPVDCPPDSPSFFNTVIELEADAEPLPVLRELRGTEAALGRPNAHKHHAPRTVDLDMLYADTVVMHSGELTLPHPRMMQRRFVLQPLADLRPDLTPPGQEQSVSEALRNLPAEEPPLVRVAETWI